MKKHPPFKHVFVLSCGRSGTLTLSRACQHIRNYTSAHESKSRKIGPGRLDYPEYHIEVDTRLAWFLGRLDQRYGSDACYVFMKRDPEAVAKSYFKRRHRSVTILPAYHQAILKRLDRVTIESARDMVETVNTNIEQFLKDKPYKMVFRLEEASTDIDRLLDLIGAEVDRSMAHGEFQTKHNQNVSRPWLYRRVKSALLFIKYRVLGNRHDN